MRVLLINPPAAAVRNLKEKGKKGLEVHECEELEEALRIMDKHRIKMVIAFLNLEKMNSFSIVRMISEKHPRVKLIALADHEVNQVLSLMERFEYEEV